MHFQIVEYDQHQDGFNLPKLASFFGEIYFVEIRNDYPGQPH